MKGTSEKFIIEEGGLIKNFLGPLMKVALPLKKIVLTTLAKSVLIPLGLTVSASKIDKAVPMKDYKSLITTLIIKVSVKQLKINQKNKKVDFLVC